jgi:site-specific DNA recombinase
LRQKLEKHGTKLQALNDCGDGSPEGELIDGILDQLAKYERTKIAERTRRGMLRRVREENPNVTSRPRYGFRYNEAKDPLLVHELEMRVVEKIFRMAADGLGLNAMPSRLHAAGVHRDGQTRGGHPDDTAHHRERHVPSAHPSGDFRASHPRGSYPAGR